MSRQRLLPIVNTDSVNEAEALGASLALAGFPIIEIVLRSENSLETLRALSRNADLIVGAGTVLDDRDVELAVQAGARFVLSPGWSWHVQERSASLNVLYIPGVATATEVMAARQEGIRLAKFFPAASIGGPSGLRALSAAFSDMTWIPTGGINADSANDYLAVEGVTAVGGSWLTSPLQFPPGVSMHPRSPDDSTSA